MSATLNYYAKGDNAAVVTVGRLTVWFSYATPVAFQLEGEARVVSENLWGTTTGKHLNAVDGGDRKGRVGRDTFDGLLAEAVNGTPVGA